MIHGWNFQPDELLFFGVGRNYWPTNFSASTVCYCYNWEPSKLEGYWSAHPRHARADWQLVVERQRCRSVPCNVIAWADCQVAGGVSGHYSATCSSLVLFFAMDIQEYKERKKERVTVYPWCSFADCHEWGPRRNLAIRSKWPLVF